LLTVDLLDHIAGLQSSARGGSGRIDMADGSALLVVAFTQEDAEPGSILILRLTALSLARIRSCLIRASCLARLVPSLAILVARVARRLTRRLIWPWCNLVLILWHGAGAARLSGWLRIDLSPNKGTQRGNCAEC
jgi:hypothetical protein